MLSPEQAHLLKTASQFDVHRWSEYPEVNEVVDSVFSEIKALRKSRPERIREADKVWRHLKVVVIDLFAAHQIGFNPYRGISLHKPDYGKNTRYRKIHLKYDYLAGVLNDLEELGYMDKYPGFRSESGDGMRTRIRATGKLIDLILSENFKVKALIEEVGASGVLQREADDEVIILHGPDGELADYDDTPAIVRMRGNLERINSKLKGAHIVLDIDDEQARELAGIYGQQERIPFDLGHNTLHRVFNGPSFRLGGRFYGGWWEGLPSRFRKYIRINYKPTVELDYSGHHMRILYSREGIEAPEDLYAIENCSFSREHLKLAALIVVNARSKTSALRALNAKSLGIDSKAVLDLIEKHFAPISQHFYTDAGLELQYHDSVVAESVMLRMMDLGAVVLPIHDSFIVRNSYEEELRAVMEEEYQRTFGGTTFLKRDQTVLDPIESNENAENRDLKPVTDDLDEILNLDSKTWFKQVFGIRGGG
jgi:hypothetical protein